MATTPIRMMCPNLKCKTVLAVPRSARGTTVRCRHCGMRIRVPGAPKPTSAETDSQVQETSAPSDA